MEDELNSLLQLGGHPHLDEEKARLAQNLTKYNRLSPIIEVTTTKSSTVVKCIEYREIIERNRLNWLRKAEEIADEPLNLENLTSVQVLLEQQENILKRLETEKDAIEEQIREGRKLENEDHAPEFVKATVDELESRWRDTAQLARAKYDLLRNAEQNWLKFEENSREINDFVQKVDAELAKPLPLSAGHQAINAQIQAKKDLLDEYFKIQPLVESMEKLNSELSQQASPHRRLKIDEDIIDLKLKLENVNRNLSGKVGELETSEREWKELIGRMDALDSWLDEHEAGFERIQQMALPSPEERFGRMKALGDDIASHEAHINRMESDAKTLAQGFRSRETATVKSKISSQKTKWKSLKDRIDRAGNVLDGEVDHWNKYQKALHQILPWLQSAGKDLSISSNQFVSLDDCLEQNLILDQLKNEMLSNEIIFEEFLIEGSHVGNEPGVNAKLEEVKSQWNQILSKIENRDEVLKKARNAWESFEVKAKEIENNHEYVQGVIASETKNPSMSSLELQKGLKLHNELQEKLREDPYQLDDLKTLHAVVQEFIDPVVASSVCAKIENQVCLRKELQDEITRKEKILSDDLSNVTVLEDKISNFELWLKKNDEVLKQSSKTKTNDMTEGLLNLQVGLCTQQVEKLIYLNL